MRLAYCNGGISVSETFIYDLATALSRKVDAFDFIGGTPLNMPVGFKYSNFAYIKKNNAIEKRIYSMISSEYRFEASIRYAQRKLSDIPGYDVAYIDYGTTAVYFDQLLVDRNIPYIVHFHGHDITSALNNRTYRKRIAEVFKNAVFVITASHHIKRLLVLEGCPLEKIRVIHIGLSSEGIVPMSWVERRRQTPGIIFIGRLTQKKNPQALIYAFDIVRRTVCNARLHIVGDGPLMNECKELVTRLQLQEMVIFYGALTREHIFPILNKQWIYAQHSVTSYQGDQEGFALSLAEAALHELPVVSTLHNGITENVVDNVTGFLVQEYNYEAMAEKMIQLLLHPDLAASMGKSGRVHIQNMCVQEERTDKILELLYEAARSK